MIKLRGLSYEKVRETAGQTADAFYDYRYHNEGTGLIKYISSKEARKSAALLKEYLPTMTERVFPGMAHCQFLHAHLKEYAALLSQTMRRASARSHR